MFFFTFIKNFFYIIVAFLLIGLGYDLAYKHPAVLQKYGIKKLPYSDEVMRLRHIAERNLEKLITFGENHSAIDEEEQVTNEIE